MLYEPEPIRRSPLDRGSSATNQVMRYPTRVSEMDQPSPTRAPPPAMGGSQADQSASIQRRTDHHVPHP
jgi:hypothetical protein